MKQTGIEGTDEPITKGKRTARELANEASIKARGYRRKALLAENADLNRLVLAIKHGRDAAAHNEALVHVSDYLESAKFALDAALDKMVGA